MALPVFIDRRVDPWLITLKVSYYPKGALCVMVQEVLVWTGMERMTVNKENRFIFYGFTLTMIN